MADGTLNRFLSRGTAAQRAAFSPSAPTPASGPNPGYIWYETDTGLLYAYDGSGWDRAGFVGADSPPVDGDFSWVNQGGASVITTNGGIHLSAPTNASQGWRIRKKSSPSTPWTLTVWFIPLMLNVSFHRVAVMFRQSSDGKLVTFEYSFNASDQTPELVVNKWTSATAFSANYALVGVQSSNLVCLRIADNATNRICSFSQDGTNFLQIHSVSRTDFLTADEIGFGADPNNATYGCGLTVVSWKQA